MLTNRQTSSFSTSDIASHLGLGRSQLGHHASDADSDKQSTTLPEGNTSGEVVSRDTTETHATPKPGLWQSHQLKLNLDSVFAHLLAEALDISPQEAATLDFQMKANELKQALLEKGVKFDNRELNRLDRKELQKFIKETLAPAITKGNAPGNLRNLDLQGIAQQLSYQQQQLEASQRNTYQPPRNVYSPPRCTPSSRRPYP